MIDKEKPAMDIKETNIISEENAQKQIDLLLKFYRKSLDDYDDDQRKSLNANLNKLKRNIREGFLEIKKTGNGKVHCFQILEFTPDGMNSPIEYKVIGGAAKKAMSDYEDGDSYGKCYAMMGVASGLGETTITKLDAGDLELVEVLGTIFLL